MSLPAWEIHQGDCRNVLRALDPASVDAIVTDPPAGIGFMGKAWDTPGAFVERSDSRDVAWDRVGGNHHAENSQDRARTLRTEGARFRAIMLPVFQECLRVLRPGGHAVVWGIPRTSHWTASAIEDAGFEVRDVITHHFGQGFPKSLDVAKAIDKLAGADPRRDPGSPETLAAARWQGWGTALKPASEHWILARKPIEDTVAENVLQHGPGALNIDACRTPVDRQDRDALAAAGGWARAGYTCREGEHVFGGGKGLKGGKASGHDQEYHAAGRWPANLVLSHDPQCQEIGSAEIPRELRGAHVDRPEGAATSFDLGSGRDVGTVPEVIPVFMCVPWCPVAELDRQSGVRASGTGAVKRSTAKGFQGNSYGLESRAAGTPMVSYGDIGGAARFFYCPKASRRERNLGGVENRHPTVKPLGLMRWLCRLVTPPGGLILDPFTGSGSTGVAALQEGFRFFGIEREPEYIAVARARITAAEPAQRTLFQGDNP